MTPKLVVRFDPKTFKPESFRYDDPGPVPPIINPEDPQKAKDAGPPAPDSKPDKNTPPKPS